MANIKISELNPLLTVEDADVLPIVDNAVTKKVTAAILRSYTQGNSVLLTGAQTVAGIKTFTSQLASSVATGTAPFSVASTTKVTNLNADLLDGLSSADFQATLSGTGIVKSTAGTISYLTDNTANWDTAYNDKINSAAVTGSGTNTLTLTQQDAGTITATWVNGTLIREVRNTTGATLTKGTIVYISSATGNKPTVTKAIASGDSTSAQTFGFIQSDLANNANGYVVVVGDLTGVDTSAFAEGAQLYLSSTVAGTFTSTKQYAPAHLVYVGIVTRSHPTLGQIEVNIQNGYELDELHNVSAQSPSNGDILQYVTSTGLWTKVAGTTTNISEGTNLYFTNARSRSAISLTTTGTSGAATYNSTTGVLNVPNYADGGITSLNGLTALSQTFAVGTSGTDFGISSATSTHTFNLPTASATNRGALSSADWTTFNNKQNALTNPVTGTGTTNYLPKFTGTSTLGNSIISDSAGVATIAGVTKINVGEDAIDIGTPSGNSYRSNLILRGTNASASLETAYFGLNVFSSDGSLDITNSNNIVFRSGGSTERMRIASGGNVLIGTSSNNTGKLQVLGDTYIYKNGEFLASVATNSNQSQFQTWYNSVGARRGYFGFPIVSSNDLILNNETGGIIGLYGGNVLINTGTDAGYKLDVNGTARVNGMTTIISGIGTGLNFKFSSGYGNSIIGLNYDSGADSNNSMYFGVNNAAGSPVTALTLYGTGSALFSSSVTTGADATINGVTVGRGGGSIAENTAIGANALLSNTTGNYNTANGRNALYSNTTGSVNTANGRSALFYNTTGSDNTANGVNALYSNTTGSSNTANGSSALFYNTTGSGNTALGTASLLSNTASNNTAVGYEAGFSNTSGTGNATNGFQTLRSNTTGSANTANGFQALYSNIVGSSNTAIGASALALNTASNNTAVGFEAGYSNSAGEEITALGYRALKANTTGNANTAFGSTALSANTTGNANTAIGSNAMNANTTGSNNNVIGYNQVCTNFSGVSMLGRSDTATGNNQMRFGSAVVNNGAVETEVNTSSKVWNVFINGVAQKILLA